METKFNFKSAICTSREQSEKLLALGLKKETADMHWAYHSVTATRYIVAHPCDGVGECIPSWSLHRLLSLYNLHYIEFMNDEEIESMYDIVIDAIEQAIKEGHFNKEYLVGQDALEERCVGIS